MEHESPGTTPVDEHASHAAYDSELDLRTILGFGAGLVIVTGFVLLVMWWMSVAFKSQEESHDRDPSPLAEARLDPLPQGPRLQPMPPRDMDELRVQDAQALTTYGWVDKPNGVARIPVERAISILAERSRGTSSAAPEPPGRGRGTSSAPSVSSPPVSPIVTPPSGAEVPVAPTKRAK